jgi:hypothetical protein
MITTIISVLASISVSNSSDWRYLKALPIAILKWNLSLITGVSYGKFLET